MFFFIYLFYYYYNDDIVSMFGGTEYLVSSRGLIQPRARSGIIASEKGLLRELFPDEAPTVMMPLYMS